MAPKHESSDDIKKKLTTLITFYFGNNNYYSDTYLKSKLDANRYFAIIELLRFNKIKQVFLEHGITDWMQQKTIILAAVRERINIHPICQTIELDPTQ